MTLILEGQVKMTRVSDVFPKKKKTFLKKKSLSSLAVQIIRSSFVGLTPLAGIKECNSSPVSDIFWRWNLIGRSEETDNLHSWMIIPNRQIDSTKISRYISGILYIVHPSILFSTFDQALLIYKFLYFLKAHKSPEKCPRLEISL